ncbi:hypothetical protein X975_26896, partial [Stegodyphus mimosarum]
MCCDDHHPCLCHSCLPAIHQLTEAVKAEFLDWEPTLI